MQWCDGVTAQKTAGSFRCPPSANRNGFEKTVPGLFVVTQFAVFGFVETGHFDFFRRP